MSCVIEKSNKKFAVLIGINYYGTSSQLNGCINDVNHLKDFLMEKCGYLSENIVTLTDDTDENSPTKQNITESFDLLVKKANEDQFEELWLSYSGHGSYTYDNQGDEDDFYDEVLCPVDYSSSGMILDDYIYDNLVSRLPSNVTLFSLMDCCHSGTILDLPYIYNNSIIENNDKEKCQATVISISGCRDDQTSADAYISGDYEGAMTWSFINALSDKNYNVQLSELVQRMRILLSNGNYSQVPMLALSSPSDVDRYFIKNDDEETVEESGETKKIIFTMKVDYWFEESTWNVMSIKNNSQIFDKDKSFERKYQETKNTVELPPGEYKLIVKDTYGDGGITSNVNNGLIVLLSANMTRGKHAEYNFTV